VKHIIKLSSDITRRNVCAFTLVEIMIVVLIIGILLAIAVPNFLQARESSRAKACIGNLKEIDTAKQEWLMDNKAAVFTSIEVTPTATSVSGSGQNLSTYLRTVPRCPESGYYETGNASQLPVCVTAGGGTTVTGSLNTNPTPHQLT
jgi:prepilin-type N-terminal cleavage/methylation domain-containing protein